MINTDPFELNGKRWVYDARTRSHVPEGTAAVGGRPAGQAADMERNTSDESMAKRKDETRNSRVSVRIVSYRSRLADPDNISGKAALDGCVHCGILRDDSTKEIASYRADEQVKVKNVSEEKTEIIITEVTQ